LAEKRFEIRAENPLFFVAYGNRETGQIRFIIKEEKARFSYAPMHSPAGVCNSSQTNKQGGNHEKSSFTSVGSNRIGFGSDETS